MAEVALTLASRSPQRRAILEQIGLAFEAVSPDVEERIEGDVEEMVRDNALQKARAVAGRRVLGVDTAVALEGRIFGKPCDAREAGRFLAALAGRTHEVWSGIALVERRSGVGGDRKGLARDRCQRVEAAVTTVRFRELTGAEIEAYVACGEWRDRAGAYAIQGRGATLVEHIEGDYLNVVGLPVATLVRMAPDLFARAEVPGAGAKLQPDRASGGH